MPSRLLMSERFRRTAAGRPTERFECSHVTGVLSSAGWGQDNHGWGRSLLSLCDLPPAPGESCTPTYFALPAWRFESA